MQLPTWIFNNKVE